MTDWQSRIVGLNKVPVNQLHAHEYNARRHPAPQREALRGSLDTLGIVAPPIRNVRTNTILDGHARVEEYLTRDENMLIDVLDVDLDENEEHLFLASFDYISSMATYDRDALDTLLQEVQTDDTRLQAMLAEMAASRGLYDSINPADEWTGMPEFEQESEKDFHNLILHFKTEKDMNEFARLIGQTVEKTTRSLYYPKLEHEVTSNYRVVDES